MNERFIYRGINFVWDRRKAAANWKNHHISFERACQVFLDPFVRVVDASRRGETRDKAVGYTEDGESVLCVVHVVLEADAIRIVSAWPATREERLIYENH
ncbi:MAG: BrnT family toxin [Burkholderiales bacterium]